MNRHDIEYAAKDGDGMYPEKGPAQVEEIDLTANIDKTEEKR